MVYIFIYSWYDKSTQTNSTEKEAEALTSVRQFYAFVIAGVSIYKHLMYPDHTKMVVIFSKIFLQLRIIVISCIDFKKIHVSE